MPLEIKHTALMAGDEAIVSLRMGTIRRASHREQALAFARGDHRHHFLPIEVQLTYMIESALH